MVDNFPFSSLTFTKLYTKLNIIILTICLFSKLIELNFFFKHKDKFNKNNNKSGIQTLDIKHK